MLLQSIPSREDILLGQAERGIRFAAAESSNVLAWCAAVARRAALYGLVPRSGPSSRSVCLRDSGGRSWRSSSYAGGGDLAARTRFYPSAHGILGILQRLVSLPAAAGARRDLGRRGCRVPGTAYLPAGGDFRLAGCRAH